MSEPVTISVGIGDSHMDYQGGNLLNAINEVVCYFQQQSSIADEQIAELLQVYAKSLIEV